MTIEDLTATGMERLTDDERRHLLERQGVGILGLAVDGEPYLLPLSFGYDGEDALYVTYVHGDESRKLTLSERAETAQFLVYEATSPVDWQSVQLTGSLHAVPADEWDQTDAALENAWRPAMFEDGQYDLDVSLYRFTIEAESGIKHGEVPVETSIESTNETGESDETADPVDSER